MHQLPALTSRALHILEKEKVQRLSSVGSTKTEKSIQHGGK